MTLILSLVAVVALPVLLPFLFTVYMARKVESWAPPYGMISMPAEALCILVERIQISELKKFPYCKNG